MTHGQTAVRPVALTFKGRQFCDSLATVSEKKKGIYFKKNYVIMYIIKHNEWSKILLLKTFLLSNTREI